REVHAVLKQANYDLQKFQFNTVVSAAMKILNALDRFHRSGVGGNTELTFTPASIPVTREAISILLCLLAPITPHVAWQLWRELGFGADVFGTSWPEPDESALRQTELELVLQVNGKMRGAVRVPSAATREAIERIALESPVAQKYIAGQVVKKVVVVPSRLV